MQLFRKHIVSTPALKQIALTPNFEILVVSELAAHEESQNMGHLKKHAKMAQRQQFVDSGAMESGTST